MDHAASIDCFDVSDNCGDLLFGLWSLVMVVVSIVACVGFEFAFQKIVWRKVTITDYSAVITGWLLALTLPVTAPLWTLLIGDFIAIIVVKQLTGGIGRNWLNPAVLCPCVIEIIILTVDYKLGHTTTRCCGNSYAIG